MSEVSKTVKLPRELLASITNNPRALRFLENLQAQVFDASPAQFGKILDAIAALSLANDQAHIVIGQLMQLLGQTKEQINSDIPLLPVAQTIDSAIGLLPVATSQDADIPLYGAVVPCDSFIPLL